MRARHALGPPGRARRVEHAADVSLGHPHDGRAGIVAAGGQRLEGERVGQGVGRGAGADPVPHARQGRTRGLRGGPARRLEHHRDAVGVVGAEAHLALRVPPVERGGDETELLAGPVRHHVLLAVLQQDDDVLAAHETQARQRRRHAIDARLEGPVRRAAAAVGDRLRRRRPPGGDGQRAGEHQNPSSTILPTTCPPSSCAWACLRLAALIGPRRVATVVFSVSCSTSAAASSRIWC